MKNFLKNFLFCTLIWAIFVFIFYACVAFYNCTWDAYMWNSDSRQVISLISGVFFLFVIAGAGIMQQD